MLDVYAREYLLCETIGGRLEVMDAHQSQPHLASRPSVPRLALSLREFGEATDLSRGMVRKLVAQGEIETIKIGRRRLVPYWRALAWTERKAA